MNMIFWALQIFLALHTAVGAVWKFSHSAEQTMPSLQAIPSGIWLAMSGLELLCALCLIVPAFFRPVAVLEPVAAIVIAVEMLLFSGLHLQAGDGSVGPLVYWLVIAALCALIAYGRLVLKPF